MGTSAESAVALTAETGGATRSGAVTKPTNASTASPTTITNASPFVARRLALTPAMLTIVNSATSASAMPVVAESVRVRGPIESVHSTLRANAGITPVTCAANPTAAAAIAPENPAMNDVQPERNPAVSPNASRRYTYSAPPRGNRVASSA